MAMQKMVNGVIRDYTPQEVAEWQAHVAALPPPPMPPRDALSELDIIKTALLGKGVLEQKDIDVAASVEAKV